MGSSKELFEAAFIGNVEFLRNSLKQNPLILIDISLTSPSESLLHVATKSGQLNFAREIIKHNPDLAKELSKDGFRPMDIASIIGNVEIVKEFLKIDQAICFLKGKDRRTALHYAAMKGRVEVIDELLSICPEAIQDITVHDQTALHLAVENNQIDAFSSLVNWLERLSLEAIINLGDHDGNTVLHLAAFRKQVETIKLLLCKSNTISGIIKVNSKNLKGLTAMDLLDMVIESPKDIKLRQILQHAGALVSHDINPISSSPLQQIKHDHQTEPSKNWFEYFKFQQQRDSPSDTRNSLLVVAALVATVTFQAGVNLPTGILELTTQSSSGNTPPGNTPPAPPSFGPALVSGLAASFGILGSHSTPYLFLFANSLGFTASLSIIIYLTGGYPFQRELLISLFSMMFTYGVSISIITENEVLTYLLLGIAFFIPFSLRWLPRWGRKAWKWWRKGTFNHPNLG